MDYVLMPQALGGIRDFPPGARACQRKNPAGMVSPGRVVKLAVAHPPERKG